MRGPIAVVLAVLVLFLVATAGAQPVPAGPEIEITGSAAGAFLPSLAAEPSGGFVAAWAAYGPGSPGPILTRRLDSDGAPVAPPSTVGARSPFGGSSQERASIAVDPEGGVLVAWEEQRSIYRDIVVGRIDAPGPATALNSSDGEHTRPRVAAAGVGRFLVVWVDNQSSGTNVVARRVDGNGQPLGGEFQVNESGTGGYQGPPDVAGSPQGDAVVTWPDSGSGRVLPRARFYASDGSARGPAQSLLTEPQAQLLGSRVAVAATPDGFVAVWAEEHVENSLITDRRLVGRTFSPTGDPGPSFRVADLENSYPEIDVAVDARGIGLVVWEERDQDDLGIRAASIDTHASTAGPSAPVHDAPDGAQYAPAVAAGASGFLVAWTSTGSTGSNVEVHLRLVSLCGNGVPEPGEECDDANRRPGDCCSPACRLEPLPGTCWRLAGATVVHFSASVEAQGRQAVCTARCRASGEATLILLDDRTYRLPQGEARCTSGERRLLPDEVGRQRGRARNVRLLPTNLAELRAATSACGTTRLGGIRGTIHRDDGRTLKGMQTVRARQPGRPTVFLRSKTRFNGVPLDAGVRPLAPEQNEAVPICTERITLRCRLR